MEIFGSDDGQSKLQCIDDDWVKQKCAHNQYW